MGIKRSGITAAVVFLAVSILGCGPSEKELKNAKIEMLQSKVRDTFSDPTSTQFRNTKLLSGEKVLCGEVNSKNAYGGYVGFQGFAVNSDGKIIILEGIPVVEVIALSKKSKEERKEYIQNHSLELAGLGQLELSVKMRLKLDEMEKFNMETFSLWAECFAEK